MANSEDNKTRIFGSLEYINTIQNKDNVEIHVNWSIPNFKKLIGDGIETIQSPPIIPTEISPGEWKFRFRINYLGKSNWVYDQEQYTIGFQELRIVNANNWYELVKVSFMGSYLEWGNKICYLKNGSLSLKFELVVIIEKEEENQLNIPVTHLSEDMKNLLLEGMYTDVVMKSAEGKEFRVHKGVLANRSVVLKANFGHNTTESITNIVESPLESAVLLEVLSFIYTDKAPKVDEIPEKLLAAADYYQLSRLKSLCEEALHKKLTVDNAIETLQLADLHSANTLKTLTLRFIWSNGKLALITKTASWANLQSVNVLKMICECSNFK